ncbi:hypothetical protein L9F63_016958 [Diploptera punctata]|uniref:Uncharacterized protein n=1 Tax=Diploptera punctata TaxID=6984 RepID=A0AAD8A002_DIPPU|nr:hypothetical protein L9F63_016958 [Diploptera punctata]
MSHKKGQTIHSEAREMIKNVIKVCDEESRSRELKYLISQKNKCVAKYCGTSEHSVSNIRKEGVVAGEISLCTPGKKRDFGLRNINLIVTILIEE